MIASLRATVPYGISPVNRDFTSCNDRVDINSVRGSLLRPELIAARNRDRTYLINTGAQRSEDLEALRLEKKAADANGESFSCPACNNPINIYENDRGFHRPTQQWLCARCLKSAKVNDDVVVQIIDQKPKRSHDPDKSEVQQDCGVNWCAQDMWSQGKLERMWVKKLATFVCPTHLNWMTVENLKEIRPLRNRCGGCGITGPKIHIAIKWEPQTHRWLCRTCMDGRPPKPSVCRTSWCQEQPAIWREDNQTWIYDSCKPLLMARGM